MLYYLSKIVYLANKAKTHKVFIVSVLSAVWVFGPIDDSSNKPINYLCKFQIGS